MSNRARWIAVCVCFAFCVPGATGQRPPENLIPSDEAGRKAQLEAAKQAERELQETLSKIRVRREELERELQARDAADVEELREDTRVVNGVATIAFPGVGALIKGRTPDRATSQCTGTLIGCRTFITANHCLRSSRNPIDYHVFFQNLGAIAVESISAQHPAYRLPEADLALLRLARPLRRMPIAQLNSVALPFDSTGTVVGFGRSGGLAMDYGVKRSGRVRLAPCDRKERTLLCWDFNAPVGLPGENSNTCNVDSGGPLFVRDTNQQRPRWFLAGVTSGGRNENCLAGDHSYDVDVRQYRAWISTIGGSDLGDTLCAPGPGVEDPSVQVVTGGRVLQVGESHDFRFRVPWGTALMVVAMNGVDNLGADFNLFVRRGGRATVDQNDCRVDTPGNYGACRFMSPTSGDWYAKVDQQGPTGGEFQIVVTMYPHEAR